MFQPIRTMIPSAKGSALRVKLVYFKSLEIILKATLTHITRILTKRISWYKLYRQLIYVFIMSYVPEFDILWKLELSHKWLWNFRGNRI